MGTNSQKYPNIYPKKKSNVWEFEIHVGIGFGFPKANKTLKRTVYKGNGPLMNINRGHKGQKRPMFPHTFFIF